MRVAGKHARDHHRDAVVAVALKAVESVLASTTQRLNAESNSTELEPMQDN